MRFLSNFFTQIEWGSFAKVYRCPSSCANSGKNRASLVSSPAKERIASSVGGSSPTRLASQRNSLRFPHQIGSISSDVEMPRLPSGSKTESGTTFLIFEVKGTYSKLYFHCGRTTQIAFLASLGK